MHEYTRHERKLEASGQAVHFDGELDNFQEPELSSLGKLVRLHRISGFVRPPIALFVEYGRYPAAMKGLCTIRFPHDSQGVRGTGIFPVRVPSATAKSAVPRFFSAEHRSIPCNNKTYSYFASSPWARVGRVTPNGHAQDGGGQPRPLWQWPFGHSIILVVLFLGYAAEDDDGWIHEVV